MEILRLIYETLNLTLLILILNALQPILPDKMSKLSTTIFKRPQKSLQLENNSASKPKVTISKMPTVADIKNEQRFQNLSPLDQEIEINYKNQINEQ